MASTTLFTPRVCSSIFRFKSRDPEPSLKMSDNHGIQIVATRSKRTHRQMAEGSGSSSDAPWLVSSYPRSGSSSVHLPPPRNRPTPRYGDDHRRPVMLSPETENDVIDLTAEPESPRRPQPSSRLPLRDIMNRDSSGPNVIDLEAEGNTTAGSPHGPDVEIIGSSAVRPMPTMEPTYFDSNGFSMYHPPPARPAPFPSLSGPWVGDNFLVSRSRSRESTHRRGIPSSGIQGSWYGDDLLSFMNSMPAMLPYNVPAFEYNTPTQPAPRSQRDSYKAPPPASKGFSRRLEEQDVPVCPNCDEELGTGSGRKPEIYVAKACGHAYCGECAENRSISKSKKSASKTKPFSRCQVADCNKPVSNQTAMTHLFL
ncbi:unnamed protein product [Penicillium salamii]|uniref:RING-type domain-containing protein n=1 Tax=Penicillium salamii TaxID=1612424 RepID=A0A9W4K222_9EURO|nr:unnamed protein product [Penicillium salamii]CAG8156343.1 unnamed protein product [Penicillium salamii]CAG8188659.1 unnamed protein product [Penicillium salamii]CAG8240603.1 unnamed protein product [Penicillium salamii]CAG8277890.1 unnamed protein product [Penicillium salamii]